MIAPAMDGESPPTVARRASYQNRNGLQFTG